MKSNKIVVITGATSGIGAAFAKYFASGGYNLLLTGRREEKLNGLARELSSAHQAEVETVVLELTDENGVQAFRHRLQALDNVEILINNAGFGARGFFMERDIKEIESMIWVHITIPVRLIHAVLPQMVKNGKGIIINVSSLGSFGPFPQSGIYGGTKIFLNFFSESLYSELHDSGIVIQALCPGFTRTDFHDKLGYDRDALKNRGIIRWMSAEKVVAYSVKHLGKKVICIPGFWNRRLKFLYNLVPKRFFYRYSKKILKKQFSDFYFKNGSR